MPAAESWTMDPDLDGIDLDPVDFSSCLPLKKVPAGNLFEASRAGDVERLRYLLDSGVNVHARDKWDSVALYYACLAGHLDAARMLLENGAICSEHTFDGDRCHYAALNLKVRKLLKAFGARPPPMRPLQAALRSTFLGCISNRAYLEQFNDNFSGVSNEKSPSDHLPPDVVFYVHGRPIEAHRIILSARSPFFKRKFETDWKGRVEVRFSGKKLSYPALHSLIHFFYSDRLEIAVDDMEDLLRICKVCECEALQMVLKNEFIHQKHAEYKALVHVDSSQKRFILQGLSLPKEDRLPAALHQILLTSLANNNLTSCFGAMNLRECMDDLADVCIRIDKKNFRCHQVVIAARSEYFRARLSHMDFSEHNDGLLPCLVEHDLSMETFEKIIEYMYTDGLKDIDPDLAEEAFDAASRYLLFPFKRAVVDVLLPHLETASPAELCHWLMLSDMYSVSKMREYCLDVMACNFEAFAATEEFRALLSVLPPLSGDSSLRATVPSAPAAVGNTDGANLLDDLREKWLEANAAGLDERDASVLLFDRRLGMLIQMVEQETGMSSPSICEYNT